MGKVTVVGGKVGMNVPKVGLPNGYTELEYIQSSGTQYIDTGFKPNQNTRVVLSAYNLSESSGWTYGTWDSSSTNQFAFSCLNSYNFRYGTGNTNLFTVPVGKLEVDQNKNKYNLNGTTGEITAQTFNCSQTMYLFAINAAGTVSSGKFTGRIFSCKIYDNDTLVRNFTPCVNPDGNIGLYDTVNKRFYGNSGTGYFSGMDLNGNKVTVTIKASDLSVGSSVYLNENGTPKEYIIVNQGIPSNSSLYDSSCNGTWLLRKGSDAEANWGSDNSYKDSSAHINLNSSLVSTHFGSTWDMIKQVKIPYHKGTGSGGSVASGSNGLSTKLFLLSAYEVGWSKSNYSYMPIDGACLSYFSGLSEQDAKRIVYSGGTTATNDWWLRSPDTSDKQYAFNVDVWGGRDVELPSEFLGLRPALILSFDAQFDAETLVLKGV